MKRGIFLQISPVGPDDLPGQVGGGGGHIPDDLGDLVGSAETSHGNVFFQRGPLLFAKLMVHLRVDDAAGNGVHRDVAGSQFFGKRPGQAVDSGFGGGVGGFTGSAGGAPHRRNVDDGALFPCHHAGNSCPAAVEYGRKVGADDPVPL